jgi:hypothetical protein
MEQETERINSLGLSEEERLAALAVLLSHETRIIQTIDRLKIEAKAENQESRINQMLEDVSPFTRPSLPRFASPLLRFSLLFRCLLQNNLFFLRKRQQVSTHHTLHVHASWLTCTKLSSSQTSQSTNASTFYSTSSGL